MPLVSLDWRRYKKEKKDAGAARAHCQWMCGPSASDSNVIKSLDEDRLSDAGASR